MAGFALTKKQIEERLDLIGKLAAQKAKVEDAVSTVNEMFDSAVANTLIPEIDKYNALLTEVKAFTESVSEEARNKYDEKSEKWQESEAGQAAYEFISSWEQISFTEEIEHPAAPEIEVELEDDSTTLEELPEQAE